MTQCNIIVVEDDRLHGETLAKILKVVHGHEVRRFRDKRTFEEAVTAANGDTGAGLFEHDRPRIIILDIMLAEELDPKHDEAPRWCGEEEPTPDQRKRYVNDQLGLEIAATLRKGGYAPAIKSNTPLVFFTARRNDSIEETALKMSPAKYFTKPAFTDDVEAAIQELVATDSHASRQGRTQL